MLPHGSKICHKINYEHVLGKTIIKYCMVMYNVLVLFLLGPVSSKSIIFAYGDLIFIGDFFSK